MRLCNTYVVGTRSDNDTNQLFVAIANKEASHLTNLFTTSNKSVVVQTIEVALI
jgi:hypothetical protein